MDDKVRIEKALEAAISTTDSAGAPPRLAAALKYAVFPAGARIRPRLCLAVAAACGDENPQACDAAAAAIELLHCASLIHDDLPCFDDADVRRGKPSVHRTFGEPLAVLAGDALIVLAFETLALKLARTPQYLVPTLLTISRAVGAPHGIVAGQAWESEPYASLATYQRAKTGSLFIAAAVSGAITGGGNPEEWRTFGETLGEAYQVADDISDMVASQSVLGKPVGRDRELGRPSSATALGVAGAVDHLKHTVSQALAAIPACDGAAGLRVLVQSQVKRILPEDLVRHAANGRASERTQQPAELAV